MDDRTMGQKLVAEFVGTFTLVFITAGSVIAASAGAGSLVTIGLGYGLAVATMVTALGHISGAHFNPAVTIGAWVTQKIEAGLAIPYLLAQLAGGAAGAGVLRAALPESFWSGSQLGVPAVNAGIDIGQAILIEAILTFFLVWVVFATVMDPEGAFTKVAGLAIGFVVLMDVMMGGPFTGAAMNPARWFGPALVGGFWSNALVYLLGPVAGGIVAAVVYDSLYLRPPHEADTAAPGPAEVPDAPAPLDL